MCSIRHGSKAPGKLRVTLLTLGVRFSLYTLVLPSPYYIIVAPLGVVIFGGKGVYERAKQDLNTALNYETLFVDDSLEPSLLISGRLQNVECITRASIGNSTGFTSLNTPGENIADIMRLELTPPSGGPLNVTLIATDRDFIEGPIEGTFAIIERTSQLITVLSEPNYAPLRKEIETITVFNKIDARTLHARQVSTSG